MNGLPGMEGPGHGDDVLPLGVVGGVGASGGTMGGGTMGMRQPRPRNKMGRRPSWSEAEVLAAVQAILEHPEGASRGTEAINLWHQQLREAFMARFRQLASNSPALAAREDVWANRSARKIISEARNALNLCRTLHRNRTKPDSAIDDGCANASESNAGITMSEFAYPAVYNWLLRSTQELRRSNITAVPPMSLAAPNIEAMENDPVGVVGGVVDADPAPPSAIATPSMSAAAAAIAAVAAANPLPPARPENASRRVKRPRTSAPAAIATAAAAASAPISVPAIPVPSSHNNIPIPASAADVPNVGNAGGLDPSINISMNMHAGTETAKRKKQELMVVDIETRRQMSELAALSNIFGPNSGAAPNEVEEYKRLVRRNALRRAAMGVLDMNEIDAGNNNDGLLPWEQGGAHVRGGRSSLSRIVG